MSPGLPERPAGDTAARTISGVAEIHEVTAEETHRAAHALLEPALAVGADSDAPLR